MARLAILDHHDTVVALVDSELSVYRRIANASDEDLTWQEVRDIMTANNNSIDIETGGFPATYRLVDRDTIEPVTPD